ncbi:VIT1/CCC1 transporter family protein [Tsukamurella soli]|uniref:VIT family protein n=1 Tax=Tsukamurella soli TaxID=644556 RepID=A0ABP8JJA9_9ACTN
MTLTSRLNRLRAAILGANDGIVSVSGLLLGVAAATGDRGYLVLASVAAIVSGALSMALGEWVSVAAQRDGELAAGQAPTVSGVQAALSSAVSFTLGGLVPAVSVIVSPAYLRGWVTLLAALVALTLTGYAAAHGTDTKPERAVLRIVLGGSLAMAVSYGIGHIVGVVA